MNVKRSFYKEPSLTVGLVPRLAALLFLLTAFCLPSAVRAQGTPGTVRCPSQADTVDSLFQIKDTARTTLSSSIAADSTSFPVISTSPFPSSGSIKIDSEIVYYNSKTSNSFGTLVRGASGTTAAAHNNNATVLAPILAVHHNTLAQAVICAETLALAAIPGTRTVNGHPLSADVTVTKSDVGLGNADNTSDANKPISTATQTALDAKVPTTTTVNSHALSANVTVTKGDVGLGNVDNTSDSSKPISTATQTGLDTKQNSLAFTPEDVANKDTDGSLAASSDTKYASQKATKTYADTKLVGFGTVDTLAKWGIPEIAATGLIFFNVSLLNDGDTVTVNGAVFTIKDAAAGAYEIQRSLSESTQLTNAVDILNASTDPLVDGATYSVQAGPTGVRVTRDTPGTAGNSFTLAKAGAGITLSGPTLMGGATANPDGLSGSNVIFTGPTVPRTYALPDAPGTVILGGATQTLTNKTISGASNTITNVSLSAGVTGDLPLSNLAQSSAASKLLGRGSSGTGDFEEITPGAGLSMSGTTLNVTTNANLTGPITSVGNATAIASQTGTGTTFVMAASPVLVTPTLGVALATSLNGNTFTAGTYTLTGAAGKTFTFNKTMSFTAADDTGVYTLPTGTKTLVDSTVGTLSSLTSIGTIGTGVWQGTVVGSTYGGTGINNAGRTLTLNTNSGTLAFSAASKTLTVSNSLTLAGTDSTVMTFPSTSATIARTDAANTFTGTQSFGGNIVSSVATGVPGSAPPIGLVNGGGMFQHSGTVVGFFSSTGQYVFGADSTHLGLRDNGALTWPSSGGPFTTADVLTLSKASSGILQIGTSSSNALGSLNAAAFTFSGATQTLSNAAFTTCSALTTVSNVIGCTASDAKLKQDFHAYVNGLDFIRSVQPQTYSFQKGTPWYDGGRVRLGLVAQEVQRVLPQAVFPIGPGQPLQIDYNAVIAAQLDAIKRLDAKITVMRKEIDQLKGHGPSKGTIQ